MSLASRVIRGGIWFQMSKFIQLGSNFIVTAILARLLTPQDFGLIGIVSVCAALVSTFTIIGLGASIVQKIDADQQQISSIYWINFAMGFLTACMVFLFAPVIASIYDKVELIPLIRIISLSFIIAPFFQIHRRLMEKDLRFSELSQIDVISAIGSGVVGIGLAYFGFGAYSLVWQSVSLTVFYSLCIRITSRWKPDFTVSFKRVKKMIFFSLKLKGAEVTRYFERNIDLLILGKLLATQIFGYYALAYRIIYLPHTRITRTFTEILFPTFSKIQNDLKRIKFIYLKSIQTIALISFPVVLIIAVYSEAFVYLIFGEKWLPVSGVLSIICAVGALQSIDYVCVSIYPAIDKPEILLKLNVLRAVLTGIAAFVGGTFGLIEAAIAILIAKCILFTVSLFILKVYIAFTFRELFKSLLGPLLGSSIILIAFFLLRIEVNQNWFDLIKAVVLSGTFYALVIAVTNLKDIKYIYSRIRQSA